MVRNARNISFGSNGVGQVRSLQKNFELVYRNCALTALVRPVLHRLSCSNEMARDVPKHEFSELVR
jgi:hypothetical protein